MVRQFLIIIFLNIFLSKCAYGQYCDSKIIQDNTKEYYKYTSRGNRCEGFFLANFSSSNDFDVVGFYFNNYSYKLNTLEKLVFTDKLSSYYIIDQLNIRGVSIPTRTNYRLDSRIQKNDSLIVPIKDVILPNNLNDQVIGFFGWIKDKDEIIYVPLEVHSSSQNKSEKVFRLIVRPRESINQIEIKLMGVTKSGSKISLGEQKIQCDIWAGSAYCITLNESHYNGNLLKYFEINITGNLISINNDTQKFSSKLNETFKIIL